MRSVGRGEVGSELGSSRAGLVGSVDVKRSEADTLSGQKSK